MIEKSLFENYHCPRKRGRYINPHIEHTRRRLFDMLLWQLGYYNDKVKPLNPPKGFVYPNGSQEVDAGLPWVSWMGHSTFYIEEGGVGFLTDPIWSERCSPFRKIGPKRLHPPPVEVESFSNLRYVLISHNHYDHLDKKTILQIHACFPTVRYIVPKGVKRWFLKHGIENVIELDWWESIEIEGGQITAVPCQHFTGRGLLDSNRSLWCGFVVEREAKSFYFVGDTGYNGIDFKRIGRKFRKMDLSLIPIGTYVPHKFMDPVHIDPFAAVKIHQETGSSFSVGMHWNTFRLSGEKRFQPPYDLFLAMHDAKLPPEEFVVLNPGHAHNW